MDIWLVHTFFAYYYLTDLIYSLKFDLLIFLMCMGLSCISSNLCNFVFYNLADCFSINSVRRKNERV